jgi:hypothetical protein
MGVGQSRKRVAVAIVCALIGGAVFGAIHLWRASQIVVLPAAPTGQAAPPSIPPTTSYLSANVSMSDAAIAAELEKVVPKSFHFDVRGDARVYGTPSRGAVSVHINPGGSQVVVSMPVGGRIQVEKRIAIVNASVGIDVSGGIDASFSPVVQPNWTVNPQLNLNAHLNRAVAKTTFGDIDITGHVQGAVGGAMNGARGAIDG